MKTDPNREDAYRHGLTGIYVRAKGCNGVYGTFDIAELDDQSLTKWLRSDGGYNLLAENTVRILLGYEQKEETS